MRTSDAVAHYGSQSLLAAALGITASAVNQWGEYVPMRRAIVLEALTGGGLKLDYPLPEGVERPVRKRRGVHAAQPARAVTLNAPNREEAL